MADHPHIIGVDGAFFMRAVCNQCCVGLSTQKPTERVGVE